MLRELTEIAQARIGTIADITELREKEEERHREILRQIVDGHFAANESLVRAVDIAYDRGINKNVIYSHLGMTGQRLGQIRKAMGKRTESDT